MQLAPQPQALECVDLSALWAGDLSPSSMRGAACMFVGLLIAALLWRQVAKAAKAVTSHRTPMLCRPCITFHHCVTDGKPGDAHGGAPSTLAFYPCASVSI